MKNQAVDICVIGGGAAGMLAAAVAAERGLSVLVFEPNRYTGKKLGITGKGRCNVTNNCSIREMMENIPSNSRFLYSALSAFSPADAVALFENLGVKLKTERGGRVFPASDKASDIVNALRRYMAMYNVPVLRERVTDIITENGSVAAVRTASGDTPCASAIICTGGLSYPLTGSTGDGYRLAEKLGHRIAEPRASLVPLVSPDEFCGEMQGLSLKNVRFSVADEGGKTVFSDFGEMLFTHFGISGPLVLSASAHMRDWKNIKYSAKIDLKPALDEKTLDMRIQRDFKEFSNRDFINALGALANKRMVPVIVKLSGIDPLKKVHSVTREERLRLLDIFKAFPISLSGPRPIGEAIVTAGGVDILEISPSTMESKLVPGLYFAGEVMDLDAYTGGFNLQIAWSTAYSAGTHARGF